MFTLIRSLAGGLVAAAPSTLGIILVLGELLVIEEPLPVGGRSRKS